MAVVATLIVIGIVLLLLETILPGLIAGALGVLALCAAVVYAFVNFGPKTGSSTLFFVVGLLGIGCILWVKFFPQSAMARMFVSSRTIGNVSVERPELLDQTGVTLTALRPAGTANLNGKRVDVVTEGSFIDKGTPVRVVAVEGMRVVVRAM